MGVVRGVLLPLRPSITRISLKVESGFWRVGTDSDVILECSHPEFCTGGSSVDSNGTASGGLCVEGHTGPYCLVCEGGYYQVRRLRRAV